MLLARLPPPSIISSEVSAFSGCLAFDNLLILSVSHGTVETSVDARVRAVLRMVQDGNGSARGMEKSVPSLLGLSETRLHRIFKRDVGKTLGSYLRDARMVRAAELITGSSLPIKAIAHDSGYVDLSNFYRDFRKVHGLTPLQLRAKQCESLTKGDPPPMGAGKNPDCMRAI